MSQCLAVRKEILENKDFWQRLPHNNEGKLFGFLKLNHQETNEFLKTIDENKEFKERFEGEAIEHRPEWQQISFYGLIRQGDKFFVYQRGQENSSYKETRLQGKISVGIGGHIEPFDKDLTDCLYREFDEEVILKKNGQEINLRNSEGKVTKESFAGLADIDIAGLIKYETDEVGEVHLGLACEIRLLQSDLNIEIRSDENLKGEMMTFKEYQNLIKQDGITPETWTEIFIEEKIDELRPKRGKERI
jgi:predicted NUDIX family phosphoesterase